MLVEKHRKNQLQFHCSEMRRLGFVAQPPRLHISIEVGLLTHTVDIQHKRPAVHDIPFYGAVTLNFLGATVISRSSLAFFLEKYP